MTSITATCYDCGEVAKLFHDPRTPPMDTAPCLCMDCTGNAYDEVLSGLIQNMTDELGAEKVNELLRSLEQ